MATLTQKVIKNRKYIIIDIPHKKTHLICTVTKNVTIHHMRDMIGDKISNLFGRTIRSEYIGLQKPYSDICYDNSNIDELFDGQSNGYYCQNPGSPPLKLQENILVLKIEIRPPPNSEIKKQTKHSLQKKNPQNMSLLFIKTLTGCTVEIFIDFDFTIKQLKVIIMEQEYIRVDDQRLIFAGQQLEDDMTLSYYNVVAESTIHLVLRLRGGMFVNVTCGNIDFTNMKNEKFDIDFDVGFEC